MFTLGIGALLLIWVSMLTQGPIPVCQSAIGANTLRTAGIVTVLTSAAAVVGFAGFVTLPVSLAFGAQVAVDAGLVAAVTGAALLYAAANLLLFGAAPVIGSTHFGLVFTMRVVPIALLATVLVGEKFTWPKSLGIALILAGVAYAMVKKAKVETRASEEDEGEATAKAITSKESEVEKPAYTAAQIRWGWVRAILGTLSFGSANALDARVVQSVDTAVYVPIRLLLPVILIGAGLWFAGTRARHYREVVTPQRRLPLAGMAVFVPISASTFMWAVQLSAQPTLLGSIHQLSLFPTILIGARVTGGKSGSLKDYWPPATICIVGVALALGLAG